MNTIKVLDLSNNFCGALIWGVFDDLNKKKDNMYKLVSPHGISSASSPTINSTPITIVISLLLLLLP